MHLSPLMATAGVAAGLGLLAIPLHRLTSAPAATPMSERVEEASATETSAGEPAVLRVRLLRPARSLEIRDADGNPIWKAADLPAGETEKETTIAMNDGALDLAVTAKFDPRDGEETALFLTVMPDGREERQAHAIGDTAIDDHLHFQWTPHAAGHTH